MTKIAHKPIIIKPETPEPRRPRPVIMPALTDEDIYEYHNQLCISPEGLKKLMAAIREYRRYMQEFTLAD